MAPSPTGSFHIGNARTALFNYLFAKKHKGSFILRIEDTDVERSSPQYEKELIDSLRWLGLEWDEGPDKGGEYGPYRQSERLETYRRYLIQLLKSGKAFWCPHDKDYLEAEAQKQKAVGTRPGHLCEFRNKKAKTRSTDAVIRFKIPASHQICFDDLIHGQICFDANDLGGDFSIARDLDKPLYNFAAVCDDFEMEISHVIRGEDHISNTPKQILIYEALKFPVPQWAHIPLILNSDRAKLSSRDGAISIESFREMGYLPEALVNFLAFLGWHPTGDREIFTLRELIREFDLLRIQKGGAIFSTKKLDWLNSHYLRNLSLKDFVLKARSFLEKSLDLKEFDADYVERVLALEKPRIKNLEELIQKVDYFFKEPEFPLELLVWKDMKFKDIFIALSVALEVLEEVSEKDWRGKILENRLIEETRRAKDQDKGRLLWPLRVALSGKKFSPSPFEILEVLGREESLRRIRQVISKLS